MAVCGIYEIVCMANNKSIIGSSVHIQRRYAQHMWELRRLSHHNPHLQNAFNLYGENNFKLVILEKCDKKDLLIKEDLWIHNKNTQDRTNGFNYKNAERPQHNQETCKKLSEMRKGNKNPMFGKHLSDNHKEKISSALKGEKSPFFGKSPTLATRQKMSKTQIGKKLSEETKIKIGLANVGKIVSKETREKMSLWQKGEKSKNWGKKASEATKLKMRLAHKERPHGITEEGRRKLSELHKGENNPMYGKKRIPETLKNIPHTILNKKTAQVEN